MGHIAQMVVVSNSLAFMEGLGAPEMMLIFVVVLVLFGGNKLPEFARGLGKSMREFKKAAAGVEEEFKRAMEDDERKKAAAALPVAAPVAMTAAADRNPDGLPPEALAPDPTMPEAAAPSIESIPPPPLIPLGMPEAAARETTDATPPLSTDVPKPDTGNVPTPTAPVPPLTGNRKRDDYS
jgi:TatA/E family protein of Tat protein translocase